MGYLDWLAHLPNQKLAACFVYNDSHQSWEMISHTHTQTQYPNIIHHIYIKHMAKFWKLGLCLPQNVRMHSNRSLEANMKVRRKDRVCISCTCMWQGVWSWDFLRIPKALLVHKHVQSLSLQYFWEIMQSHPPFDPLTAPNLWKQNVSM